MNPINPIFNCVPLEEEFAEECFPEKLDLTEHLFFDDYFEPNEIPLEEQDQHFTFPRRGCFISCSAERLNFRIPRLDKKKCEGVINSDKNPRIKALHDFNHAMMRISKDVEGMSAFEKYQKLTAPISTSLKERVEGIRQEIENSDLPDRPRTYILKNLNDFAQIFFNASKGWRSSDLFMSVNYAIHRDLFYQIKAYVDTGNCISVVRDMNHCVFNDRIIALVDTSNISNYCILNLKGNNDFCPRVIWTDVDQKTDRSAYCKKFHFYSYIHRPLTPSEEHDFEHGISLIKKATYVRQEYAFGDPYALWLTRMQRFYCRKNQENPMDAAVGAIQSKATTEFLRDFWQKNAICFSPKEKDWVLMCIDGIPKLNTIPIQSLMAISRDPRMDRFAPSIVASWKHFNPEVFFALSGLPSWRKMMVQHFSKRIETFSSFLQWVDEKNLRGELIAKLGQQDFESLCLALKT